MGTRRYSVNAYSDEDIEAVKKLYLQGLSTSIIAQRLQHRFRYPFTRNAVIGLSHRKGWPLRGTTVRAVNKRVVRKPRVSPMAKLRREQERRASGPPCDELGPLDPMPVEDDPNKAARLVPLADLEPHHCRWPIGDPKRQPFGFCGEQIVAGLPYCKAHALRAYTPPKPRQRKPFSFHPRKPLEVVS